MSVETTETIAALQKHGVVRVTDNIPDHQEVSLPRNAIMMFFGAELTAHFSKPVESVKGMRT